MAAALIRFGPRLENEAGEILLQLDASTAQRHERMAEVTDHPIEGGANVTDHIRLLPVEISVDGIIGATSPDPTVTDSEAGREIAAWGTILDLIENKTVVRLITTLRTYPDMVITLASTERRATKAIYPSLTFKQIKTVPSEMVEMPPEIIKPAAARASGPGQTDVGKQATEKAPEIKKSFLKMTGVLDGVIKRL